MFYTYDELEQSAEAVGRIFGCCDAMIKYGTARACLITNFLKNLFFQELDYYKTFIRD